MHGLVAKLALSVLLTLSALQVQERQAFAHKATPNDPIIGCAFPSNAWWLHCWSTPYGPVYTQAWIGPYEYDNTYGWHHNLHLQPSGAEYTDYANFHVYYDGVINFNNTSQYAWRIYCSDTSGYGECGSWNVDKGNGREFYVSTTSCMSSDKYVCASYAAGNMLDYMQNLWQNSSFYNSSFPNFRTYVLQTDGTGNRGTLQNAFCDAITTVWYCADR
jgi:hypothetical protein